MRSRSKPILRNGSSAANNLGRLFSSIKFLACLPLLAMQLCCGDEISFSSF